MHGAGTISYGRGNEFVGEFVNGKAHGPGVRLFADGDRFEGNYLNGKREGHGTYHYANGDTFEGEYVDGLREGPGVYRYFDGESYEGVWVKDTYKQDSGRPKRLRHKVFDSDGKDAHRMLMQENDELRAHIKDLRGMEPLNLRRAADTFTTNMTCFDLRAENSRLAAFIHFHHHSKFVLRLNDKRVPARAVIVGDATLISSLPETAEEGAAVEDGHRRIKGAGGLYTIEPKSSSPR